MADGLAADRCDLDGCWDRPYGREAVGAPAV